MAEQIEALKKKIELLEKRVANGEVVILGVVANIIELMPPAVQVAMQAMMEDYYQSNESLGAEFDADQKPFHKIEKEPEEPTSCKSSEQHQT